MLHYRLLTAIKSSFTVDHPLLLAGRMTYRLAHGYKKKEVVGAAPEKGFTTDE
jgi:hypothetical protein